MRPDRGFVLPTTLMVMTLLTVLLAGAFVLVSAEFRATDNTLSSQRALAIAQAGLQNYLSRNNNLSSGYDSVASITFSGGYASVAASRLVAAQGSQSETWSLRSYGYVTDRTAQGTIAARRVVATLATLNTNVLPVRAAFTAMNRVMVHGQPPGTGLISGHDVCTANMLDTTGLTVATSNDYQAAPPGPGPVGGISYIGSASALYDSTHIDWVALLGGDFTPDYDITSGTWPAAPPGYPIYYSSGDAQLPSGTRYGVLVVAGNLTIVSNAVFRGIIVVGGWITNRISGNNGANFAIQGAVIGGLNNAITANSVGTSDLYRFGSPGFQWGSCYVTAAAAAMGFLSPIPSTWTDNWSLY